MSVHQSSSVIANVGKVGHTWAHSHGAHDQIFSLFFCTGGGGGGGGGEPGYDTNVITGVLE